MNKNKKDCKVYQELKKDYDIVLTTEELQKDYEVVSFGYGYCFAIRKEDGIKGSFNFTHIPRYYYNFK